MLSSHTVGFQWPDNSNLANLTPGLCNSSWSWEYTLHPPLLVRELGRPPWHHPHQLIKLRFSDRYICGL